jgi:hypothetical protein
MGTFYAKFEPARTELGVAYFGTDGFTVESQVLAKWFDSTRAANKAVVSWLVNQGMRAHEIAAVLLKVTVQEMP